MVKFVIQEREARLLFNSLMKHPEYPDLNYTDWKTRWTLNTTSYQEEDADPEANAEEQEKNQDRNKPLLFLRGDLTFFQNFCLVTVHFGHISLPIAHCLLDRHRPELKLLIFVLGNIIV